MNQPRGTIGPEDYQQIREVFEAAVNHPVADRVGFVERACSGNAGMISEVRRMLAADAELDPMLDGYGLSGPRLREGGRFANHFEIGRTLGRGGMGEVYLGRDTNLNREVAIKVLPSTFTRDPDRLARFRREAQVLASLNHPNIGGIYSFEDCDGIQALTLEYVEGPTLADRIARGPMPLETALSIARQDGKRIAFAPNSVDMPDEPAVIWLYDLAGNNTMRRLTYSGHNRFPIWTADSSRVVFQSDRDGDLAIFWQRADAAGTAERLTRPEKGSSHVPESWSRTDDVLLYSVDNGFAFTLWTLSQKTGKTMPFGGVRSVYPTDARFSPDGKWIVYASAESPGPTTIYVQPFPATGAKYQLFVKGINDTPQKPAWSTQGNELFYVPRFGGFEAVKVTTRPEFAFGTASQIPRPFVPGSPNTRSSYDVTPDGRFLGMFPADGPGQLRPPREIAVVLDWFDELRAKVP